MRFRLLLLLVLIHAFSSAQSFNLEIAGVAATNGAVPSSTVLRGVVIVPVGKNEFSAAAGIGFSAESLEARLALSYQLCYSFSRWSIGAGIDMHQAARNDFEGRNRGHVYSFGAYDVTTGKNRLSAGWLVGYSPQNSLATLGPVLRLRL